MSDEQARRRIAEDLDATLFVEAGAGTGKTTALVHRVVRLVATGRVADLGRLAAITFTEAAAAELRERVRAGLEDAATDPDLPPDERARCATGAATVDDATLTTLHGFAARLLAEHPLEAGVPPGFDVVDEVAERVELDERWQAFLGALLDDPAHEAVLLRAFALRLTEGHLRAIVERFHASWDRLVGVHLAAERFPTVDPAPVLAALDVACAHLGRNPDDRLGRYLLAEVGPFRDRVRAAAGGDEVDLLRALDRPALRPGGRGTAAVWGGDKAAVVAAVEAAEREREAIVSAVRRAVLTTVLPLLARFVLDLAAARRRAGRLAFHDLLVLARDLLRSDAEVRTELASRWDRILLDEFQDTDPLQIEVATLLALADPAVDPPPPWQDADVVPGKLFLVGDPKQSIYRFRRADIGVYELAAHRFAAGLVHLSRNFRTVPSVLAWVNRAFGEILGDGEPGGQPAYVDLEASRDEAHAGGEPAVAVVGGPMPGAAMGEVREREAAAVAGVVRRMRDDGWQVTAPDGGLRALRFADVAVLVPTRTPLGAVERALDAADVPYRIESRSLVYATDEVRELLAVLEAVDDPGDDVAVVTALRSPGFACADDELAEWRAAGGRWDPRSDPPAGLPPDHPVADAMAKLAELHARHWWEPVPALVARVVRECRLAALTTAHPRPRDHWRRIRFVVDQARAWAEAGGLTLAGFLAWARRQADEDARVLEVVAPEEDDDAVRILTVHGAKGLEFPAVVLAGLGALADSRSANVLWGPDGPEVAVGTKGDNRFETPGYDDRRLTEARMEELEGHRLLYVAATRARDHLVVNLFHKPTGNGRRSAAELLAGVCAGPDAGCRRIDDVPAPPPVPAAPPEPEPSVAEVESARAAWAARTAAAVAASARPPTLVATALAHLAHPGAGESVVPGTGPGSRATEPDLAEPDLAGPVVAGPVVAGPVPAGPDVAGPDVAGPVVAGPDAAGPDPVGPDGAGPDAGDRAPGTGAAVGRAVHAALQVADLATGAGLREMAVAAAAREHVGDRADLVAAMAESARRADVVQLAVRSGRWWREVPVAAPLGGGVVEGVVDLLVEDAAGRLVVVDYKTDAVADDHDVDRAVARHRFQAAAYAAALEAVLGREVARAVLVFARPGGAVERDVPDLAAAKDEVAALVGTWQAGALPAG